MNQPPKQVIFIRHAQSMRNVAPRIGPFLADEEAREMLKGCSDHDTPITSDGWTQANDTGRDLRDRFSLPDLIFHSGYVRTMETLEGILAVSKSHALVPARASDLVREREPGHASHMTAGEAKAYFPWLAGYWEQTGPFYARPPGGESIADVTVRIRQFLEMLQRTAAGKRVWVITHGNAILATRYILEEWTHADFVENTQKGHLPKNCSLTIYDYCHEAGQLKLTEYNTVRR